ncbi:MAG TPA: CoA transferase [Amycolatopsis sp.]|nr:CoA transferase [Amycolatopsis sp.]
MTGPLAGVRVAVPGGGAAAWHAARMLRSLGAEVDSTAEHTGVLRDWAESGAMALTGRRDGPALVPPGAAASAVRGALYALELLTGATLPGARVLSERAALAGWRRDAPRSVGGALRALRCADGWLGVNLARDTDIELLPAWLEEPVSDPWPALEKILRGRETAPLVERARMLGLPAAAWSSVDCPEPFVLNGERGRSQSLGSAVVVDLSSLWAGPLCGHLLTLLGARVIKVESTHRPDGARSGPREFYDLLHAGQESVAVDFTTGEGRRALRGLVEAADIVIEGSRPRALRQLGIDADEVLACAADKCWVSITAYGRDANAVGFGDDVALAGGLLAFDPETGTPAPCGDAIADPVTGVNAALVAVACRLAGGRWLADLAMRDQIAATMVGEPEAGDVVAAAPEPRRPAGRAPELGVDTARVLREML